MSRDGYDTNESYIALAIIGLLEAAIVVGMGFAAYGVWTILSDYYLPGWYSKSHPCPARPVSSRLGEGEMKTKWGCVLVTPIFKVGDPAPEGYLEWCEWAEVQHKAGLRQVQRVCGRWHYPFEICKHTGMPWDKPAALEKKA
jgi:hypothetical protein